MEPEQNLTDKLMQLGYPTFEVTAGTEDIPMLYIDGNLICSANYALTMSDEQLKALIDETVIGGQ